MSQVTFHCPLKDTARPTMLAGLSPRQFSLEEHMYIMPCLKNLLHFPTHHNQLPKAHAEGQGIEQLLRLFCKAMTVRQTEQRSPLRNGEDTGLEITKGSVWKPTLLLSKNQAWSHAFHAHCPLRLCFYSYSKPSAEETIGLHQHAEDTVSLHCCHPSKHTHDFMPPAPSPQLEGNEQGMADMALLGWSESEVLGESGLGKGGNSIEQCCEKDPEEFSRWAACVCKGGILRVRKPQNQRGREG